MPTPAEILASLALIANDALAGAIAWHAAVAIVFAALGGGWQPTTRKARALLALPLFSVSCMAFAFDNVFNGIVAIAGAVGLAALSRVGDRGLVRQGRWWISSAGASMIVFAWVYPHFLRGSPLIYLVGAPLGLLPCPTLSLIVGFALLGNGLGSLAWSLALSGLALFYGLFGVVNLRVTLDVGLILGAVALLGVALVGAVSARQKAPARQAA